MADQQAASLLMRPPTVAVGMEGITPAPASRFKDEETGKVMKYNMPPEEEEAAIFPSAASSAKGRTVSMVMEEEEEEDEEGEGEGGSGFPGSGFPAIRE
jgi:hypothetical protein